MISLFLFLFAFQLAEDPVANVRFNAAKTLAIMGKVLDSQ